MDIKTNKHINYKKSVDEAFILAAGFGRRLMPLTKKMPKPLVEINQKPMIDYIFDALATIGINKIYINTHYQHKRIFEFIERKKISSIQISHETTLLDTGGGIKNAINPDTTQAIMIINCDAILLNNYSNLLQDLQKKFNPEKMDALLAF
ncbi:MAG: sugar phosphate nucleotidyltransferase, partial [Pseudomonadota bacterium]|nr:sugar phosphate nucleotidyltransferase [Pseudomonadota bacterium]